MKRSIFCILIVSGLIVRLLGMGSWGTFDNEVQKAWAARAASEGLADIYGPPDRQLLQSSRTYGLDPTALDVPWTEWEWGGRRYTVDYPPGSLLFLWSAGKLFNALETRRANHPLFNAAINLFPLLGSGVIAFLLWRSAPAAFGGKRALAFWLNPAVILAVPFHGYQDTIFGAFALGATLALWRGRHAQAAVLITASILIKPQGALLLPTLIAVMLRETRWRTWIRAVLSSAVTAAIVLWPWWSRGHLLSAVLGGLRPLSQTTLSAQGFNLWWIAGWLMDRASGAPDMLARIVQIHEFEAWAGWDPRLLSRALVCVAALGVVTLVAHRLKESRHAIPLSIVLMTHAYALLNTAVHENHVFLAVIVSPLLLDAWPRARAIVGLSSAFLFLNLFLTFGLGRRVTRLAWVHSMRTLPGLDVSLIVALFHAVILTLVIIWATRRLEARA
ncbi:MAG: hypothetical protein JXO72_12970 [Vicinamibacteria bacterium]|nr:hypothetical protein [Vicinamibacteria bacterium]